MNKDILSRKNARNICAVIILLSLVLLFSAAKAGAETVNSGTGKVDAKSGAILRKNATTDSASLGTLKNNTKLTVLSEVFSTSNKVGDKNKWFYVSVNGKKGYLRGDLVDTLKYDCVDGEVTSSLNYRVGPNAKMKKVGTYKKGKDLKVALKAKVRGIDDEWYKIKDGSNYRYVSSDWVVLEDVDANAVTNIGIIKPNFTLENETVPGTLSVGCAYTLKGTLKCSKEMDKVVIGIADSKSKWLQSETVELKADEFDISTVDANIKFGKLSVGDYYYKAVVTVDGKEYTAFSYEFKVIKASNAEKIANAAWALAWPVGTDSSKYNYSGGSATEAFASAIDQVFPKHNSWGAAASKGASCDVFAGTSIRYSGYDTSAPRGLSEQIPYFENSSKYQKVNYTGDVSELKTGDIIIFSRKNSSSTHVMIYIEKNGKSYIAEANYQKTFGYIVSKQSAVKDKISLDNKRRMYVYRAVEG